MTATSPKPTRATPADRVRQAGRFVLFVGWYLVVWVRSNLTVMADILTPGSRISAAFLQLDLHSRTDLEITTIANLISLTPGTVTVASRRDPAAIWVHGMYVRDVEAFRADLLDMERRMLGAMRPVPVGGAR